MQGGTGAAKATVALQECKSLQLNNKSVSITGVISLQSSGYLKFSTPSAVLRSMNSLGNAKRPIPAETALWSYNKVKLNRFSVMPSPPNPAITQDMLYYQKHPRCPSCFPFLFPVWSVLCQTPSFFYKCHNSLDNSVSPHPSKPPSSLWWLLLAVSGAL